MNIFGKCAVLFCVFVEIYSYLDKKPAFLKTCRLSDPEFTKCSTISIQGLFDELAVGIDGLDAIGTIDPLNIQRISVLQGEGPVAVNATLNKVSLTGFGKTKVVESRVSSKDLSWETRINLPLVRLEALYKMKGRILIIPLNGHGRLWLEPSNMDITFYSKTHLYEKGGHKFYNVTDVKVGYTMSGMKLRLNNLFNGVKNLEDNTNQFLNQNWRPAADALQPLIVKTIEDILFDLMKKIFDNIPAEFFIEDLPSPAIKISLE